MFGAFMKYMIFSDPDSLNTIRMQGSKRCLSKSIPKEVSARSYKISEQAEDMALYSAFVEDLETHSCFLHFQEIRELPRDMHQLVVDR